ncbi:hypothetical protein EDB83DRAFT_2450746 [Lactarius deliciosus]|nr:hypothetical protein EDB83DRAFT_2450746 [Lactarius deliciosus]
MDALQLGRFIERAGIQTPLSQAEVRISRRAISISFTNSTTSSPLRLQISCKQLDWQLSSMAQVCDQFSPFLFRVNNLRVNTTQSSDLNGADEQWLELIRAFGGATDLWVADELATAILCPLGLVGVGPTTVLPNLRHLRMENPKWLDERSWDALQSFIASRSLSGRPVQVNVPSYQCHICYSGFRQPQGLERHVNKHTYRIACSYCDFECTVGHNDLLRAHLARKHPEVAPDDDLVSNPPSRRLIPLQFDHFVHRHSSLRAPEIVAPHPQLPGIPTPDEIPA